MVKQFEYEVQVRGEPVYFAENRQEARDIKRYEKMENNEKDVKIVQRVWELVESKEIR